MAKRSFGKSLLQLADASFAKAIAECVREERRDEAIFSQELASAY